MMKGLPEEGARTSLHKGCVAKEYGPNKTEISVDDQRVKYCGSPLIILSASGMVFFTLMSRGRGSIEGGVANGYASLGQRSD